MDMESQKDTLKKHIVIDRSNLKYVDKKLGLQNVKKNHCNLSIVLHFVPTGTDVRK